MKFLGESNRRYLLATKRGELADFQADLGNTGWSPLPKNPQVQVKLFERESVYYLLARSRPRTAERNRRSAAASFVAAWRPISRSSAALVDAGKLKKRDKIVERVGAIEGAATSESRAASSKSA